MKTQAIVPAAGSGSRFNSTTLKSLALIKDKPLFVYGLEVLQDSEHIDSIVLVAPKEELTEFERNVRKYRLRKVTRIIAGGTTRSQSVYHGLKVIDEDTDIVLVHDGARPLVTHTIVDGAITLCYTQAAVVVAVPVKSTIKRVDPGRLVVKETLDRGELWEVQTPQVFKKDILVKAYQAHHGEDPTDEAALVEKFGVEVKVMEGDYLNLKITTKEDFFLAQALLDLRP